VGGQFAKPADFPSTLIWTSRDAKLSESYCTGAKISETQILTAAHCVLVQDQIGDQVYWGPWSPVKTIKPGVKLKFSFKKIITDSTRSNKAIIKSVSIPIKVEECMTSENPIHKDCYFRVPKPDVAVIEIIPTDAFNKAPVTKISYKKIIAGEGIFIAGFGSQEESYRGPTRMKFASLKVSKISIIEKALSKTFAKKDGYPDWSMFYGNFSPIEENSPNHANLGFGDSGGPVYNQAKDRIIGVNSDGYCQTDRSCDLNSNSIFARISGKTGDWLRQIIK
jgi:hypothetical protein